MSGATANGYPYVEPGDAPRNYPALSVELAQKIELLHKNTPGTDGRPYAISWDGANVVVDVAGTGVPGKLASMQNLQNVSDLLGQQLLSRMVWSSQMIRGEVNAATPVTQSLSVVTGAAGKLSVASKRSAVVALSMNANVRAPASNATGVRFWLQRNTNSTGWVDAYLASQATSFINQTVNNWLPWSMTRFVTVPGGTHDFRMVAQVNGAGGNWTVDNAAFEAFVIGEAIEP